MKEENDICWVQDKDNGDFFIEVRERFVSNPETINQIVWAQKHCYEVLYLTTRNGFHIFQVTGYFGRWFNKELKSFVK